MATHSRILAWRIPWTGAWQATVPGVTRVGHNLGTKPPIQFMLLWGYVTPTEIGFRARPKVPFIFGLQIQI